MKSSKTRTKTKASAGQADLRRRCLKSGLLLFALVTAAFPQNDTDQTFYSRSNIVLVPALVRNQSGDLVYGLQAKDFILEDNGVVQSLRLDQPEDPEPLSIIVAVETGRKAEHEFPRIRGLSSMLNPILEEPGTEIALVTFDSQIQLLQDFTSDGGLIEQKLNHLRPGDDGAIVLDTVNYCVGLLNKVPEGRQRVLLLISEPRDHGSKAARINNVVTLIGNSNITIYSLVFSPALTSAQRRLRGADTEDVGAPPVDVYALLQLAQAAMKKNTSKAIASQTGGEYELFDSQKEFEARMIDFTNHLHNRYLLSFQPSDPQPGLHQIRLRLKHPAGAAILARPSYWVQPSSP